MKLVSPAKVNLFFRVLKKRSDGFHEIASLFQAVDLFDELEIDFSIHDTFSSSGISVPWDENHLVYKALKLFRKATSLSTPVAIHLHKSIPVGAGLGGGSSNAATTLFALNQLHDFPLSLLQIKDLAKAIGADVPFFFSSGCCYCEGIGEILSDVENLPLLSFSIVVPNFHSETVQVYKNFDLKNSSCLSPEDLLASFYDGTPILLNDLETSAFEINPQLRKLKKRLLSCGSCVMTGSGSGFLYFGDQEPDLIDASLFQVQSITKNPSDKQWFSRNKSSLSLK